MERIAINVTPNVARGEVSGSFRLMGELRRKVLTDGLIREEERLGYRDLVVTAGLFCRDVDGLRDADFEKRWLGRVASAAEKDRAVRGYDSLQDRWWMESEKGAAFVGALRMFAMHYLHGGVTGSEDVFHAFQVLKFVYEAGEAERGAPDFIEPAYGGLYLPEGYLGRLLADMTGNSNLVPLPNQANENRLTLRLDWYPADGQQGVEEMVKLIEAARTLGYVRVEFRMPPQYKYAELRERFGSSLQGRVEHEEGKMSWRGSLPTIEINGNGQGVSLQKLFQDIEFGEMRLSEAGGEEFEGRADRVIVREGGVVAAAGYDFLGFARRISFAAEHGNSSLSVGIFFAGKGQVKALLARVAKHFAGLLKDASSFNTEACQRALIWTGEKIGAQFAYAVFNGANYDEINVHAVEEKPVWCDGK